jgi:hypothetical protein
MISLISSTCPLMMDGPNIVLRFRDFKCSGRLISRICDFLNHVMSMNSPIGTFFESLDLYHASSTDGRLKSALGVSLWRFPIPHFDKMTSTRPHNGAFLRNDDASCPQDSRFAESRYANGPFLFRNFPESSDLCHTSPQDGRS